MAYEECQAHEKNHVRDCLQVSSKQSPFWQAHFSRNTTYGVEYRGNYIKNTQNRILEDLFGLKNLQIPPNPEVTEETTWTKPFKISPGIWTLLILLATPATCGNIPDIPRYAQTLASIFHTRPLMKCTLWRIQKTYIWLSCNPGCFFWNAFCAKPFCAQGNHQKRNFFFTSPPWPTSFQNL